MAPENNTLLGTPVYKKVGSSTKVGSGHLGKYINYCVHDPTYDL